MLGGAYEVRFHPEALECPISQFIIMIQPVTEKKEMTDYGERG